MDEKMRAAPDVAGLVEALDLALEYWRDRQQRYKNRRPKWVVAAESALAAHPHNGEQGGEWIRCDERQTDAINHALDVLSKHGDAFTSIGAMQVLEEMLEPQPPKSKEGK